MTKIFAGMSMSLDGYIAGPNISDNNPLGDGGERLHDWMFAGKSSAEAEAYEEEKFRSFGAGIMGRTMLDLGLGPWGENPTFHMPIFVLTHREQEPIVKQGGTTYHFVTGGFEQALKRARASARDKNLFVLGGANVIQQFIKAGLLNELEIYLVPLLLGSGRSLFEDVGPAEIHKISSTDTAQVTHLKFKLIE